LDRKCHIFECRLNSNGICRGPNPERCVYRNLGVETAEKKTDNNLRRYGWRGFSIVTFCPSCMTAVLTFKEAEAIVKAVASGYVDKAVSIVERIPGVAGFIADNEETAQLLERRVVVYPICLPCSTNVGQEGFLGTVEHNLILSRRFIKLVKKKV